MDKAQKPILWTLLTMSICLFGLGIYALRNEATAAALGSGSTRLPHFVQVIGNQIELPLSVEGRRVLLDTCEKGLQESLPLLLRFASPEQRQMIAPFCADLARAAVQASAADSYAWAILALAQVRLGDFDSAEDSLIRSSLTAPTEAWIARARFEILQDYYDQFTPRAHSIGEADTLVLLAGRFGNVVARRYIADATFRPRAEALVQSQPDALQRRFVSLIRQQV